jgi:nicotinamidase-related amidase
MKLTLPVRFWRAVPSRNPDGHITETWDIDLARVCFVSMHAWNIGCPGGPPVPEEFWVDMGSPQNHDAGWEIIVNEVAPSLEAARAAGLTVVHVQPETIGDRYPERQPPRTDREHHAAATIPTQKPVSRGPISDHASQRAERVHGAGFGAWDGWKGLDFAETLRPIGSEPVVVADDQWDDWLRTRGIDTLIYVGFCTNLCILDAPGGMRRMAPRGYRCILLREATLGVEFPDTLAERTHTNVALRYIEAWVGYTASAPDFRAACSELAR